MPVDAVIDSAGVDGLGDHEIVGGCGGGKVGAEYLGAHEERGDDENIFMGELPAVVALLPEGKADGLSDAVAGSDGKAVGLVLLEFCAAAAKVVSEAALFLADGPVLSCDEACGGPDAVDVGEGAGGGIKDFGVGCAGPPELEFAVFEEVFPGSGGIEGGAGEDFHGAGSWEIFGRVAGAATAREAEKHAEQHEGALHGALDGLGGGQH